jgi:hypothetical protein
VIEELIVIPFHNMVHSCHMRWTAWSWYHNWYQNVQMLHFPKENWDLRYKYLVCGPKTGISDRKTRYFTKHQSIHFSSNKFRRWHCMFFQYPNGLYCHGTFPLVWFYQTFGKLPLCTFWFINSTFFVFMLLTTFITDSVPSLCLCEIQASWWFKRTCNHLWKNNVTKRKKRWMIPIGLIVTMNSER